MVKFITIGVPDAPRNLEPVDVSKTSITIDWQPPRNDGGAPIRGYHVERRQGFSSRFIPISKDLVPEPTYTDTNVYHGMEYEYRVRAENEAGPGAWSQPCSPIQAKEAFSKFKIIFFVLLPTTLRDNKLDHTKLVDFQSKRFFCNVVN